MNVDGSQAAVDAIDVSILVVSYNTRELTLECLRSTMAETRTSRFEIVVVDNRSSDGSPEAIRAAFPGIAVLEPGENLGFARANNLAAGRARGRRLLLLNPDTVVRNGAIDRLVRAAEELGDHYVLGGRTVHPDGSLNRTSCWGRPTLWSTFCLATGLSSLGRFVGMFDRETMRTWPRNTFREVDIVSGCFLLVSRAAWQRLGGFDERFALYGEDFDLCMRARTLGMRCAVVPEAEIVHYGSASERVKPDQLVRQMKAKAQLIRKHWSPVAAKAGVWLLSLRVFIRAYPAGILGGARREGATAWQEAWRRRAEWVRPQP